MPLTRRALIATAVATLLAPRPARAAALTDDVGRAVQAPTKVQRVYPAGLPAAILLYTLAPDLLLGWPRSNRPQDCAYMLPDICARPEVGRITGRSDTANLETVAALKPDLILDVGSTGPVMSRWPIACSSRLEFPMPCSAAASWRCRPATRSSAA